MCVHEDEEIGQKGVEGQVGKKILPGAGVGVENYDEEGWRVGVDLAFLLKAGACDVVHVDECEKYGPLEKSMMRSCGVRVKVRALLWLGIVVF